MNDLEELKRLLAEADESDPDVDPALYTAFRNAIPDLIARVERAEKERDELSWRLSMALRQWRMYAELEERELMVEDSTEAALYRSCSAALTGDTPNV